MAGTVIADNLQAAATSQLVIKNGVASTPPTIQDSGGTEIGTFCRAWVNFNGTGTVAIRGSFNVTSITDNGTGNYTINFTTAMPDINYSIVGTTAGDATYGSYAVFVFQQAAPTSSSCNIATRANAGTLVDTIQVNIAIFR